MKDEGNPQGAASGPGHPCSAPNPQAVSALTGGSPSRMALLPMDDAVRSFNDSILPSVMIWAGGEAYDNLRRRNALFYAESDALDLDSCAIAVGIYRAMTAAAAKALRSAPCDGSGEAGETAQAGSIRQDDSAVDEASSEVEAPASQDLKALQAEKDRLRAECDVLMAQAGACAEEVDRVRVEIGTVQAENDRLTTALAESERKRVEAEHAAIELARAAYGVDATAPSEAQMERLHLRAGRVFASTPTQETAHVEG